MKKRNKKGFTLVELIVVATIMVMIMGAILNWVRPMNKFYDRTQALADSNDVGSILMDYVDDELRYCTNIVVLQGYDGVPKLSGGYLVDSSNNVVFKGKLTDALIIDNEAIRGSQFDGYDPNSNASHRKEARGCIIKASIKDDVGIDVNHLKCLGSEAIYNDYGFHFEASLNTLENSTKNISIDTEITRPVRDGAVYKFEKFGFNQTRDFELININLPNATDKLMYSDFYTSSGEGKPIDYSTIAQSSNIGVLKGKYTYILYTKLLPDVKEVKVSIFRNETDKTPEKVIPVICGASIDGATIDSLIATGKLGEGLVNVNGEKKNRVFKGFFSGDTNIEEFRSRGVTQAMSFYYRYEDETLATPNDSFIFKDKYASDDRVIYFYDPAIYGPTAGIVNWNESGNGQIKDGHLFIGWNTSESPVADYTDDNDQNLINGWFVDGANYTQPMVYYAIYKECQVKTLSGPNGLSFNLVEGVNNITDDSSYKDLVREAINNPSEENKDKVFSHLEVINSDTGESKGVLDDNFDFNQVNDGGTYSIKPVYNENTHPGAYEVTLTFDTDADMTWSRLAFNNTGKIMHLEVCKEDGVTVIYSDKTDWYHSVNNVFFKGDTVKIYVYDNCPVILVFNNSNYTVDSSCRLKYDGTNFEEVG